MNTRLSQWLIDKADNINIAADDIQTKSLRYLTRLFLLDLASVIDETVQPFLWLKAKFLWKCDQLRSKLTKDEEDQSLGMNLEVILDLNEKDRKKYDQDLTRRRRIAHEKELIAEDRTPT